MLKKQVFTNWFIYIKNRNNFTIPLSPNPFYYGIVNKNIDFEGDRGIMGIDKGSGKDTHSRGSGAYSMEGKLIQHIFFDLKEKIPDLYREVEEQARWSYKDRGISLEEMIDTLAKEKIRDTIRNDKKRVQSVLKEKISEYSEDDLQKLLQTLFYLRYCEQLPRKFYRNYEKKDTVINTYKSINTHLGKGGFTYKYEEFYQALYHVALEQGFYERGNIKSEQLRKALIAFYEELIDNEKLLLNSLHRYEEYSCKTRRKYLLDWYEALLIGLKAIVMMECHQEYSLLCGCFYFSVIYDSIHKITRRAYIELEKRKKIKDLSVLYNKVLEKIKVKCNENNKNYDMIQNYGLHTIVVALRREQNIWVNILDYLYIEVQDGNYKELEEKYTVVNIDDLEEKELKKRFCEEKRVRDEEFNAQIQDCEKVLSWYKKKHLWEFTGNMVEKKAIYREVFVNKKIPNDISRRDMKAFINRIKENKIDATANMGEVEAFVIEKIERGIYREYGKMEEYIIRNRFEDGFHRFLKNILEDDNMRGTYLSNWAFVLIVEFYHFLKGEL